MYVWKKIISKFRWHCISVWSLVAVLTVNAIMEKRSVGRFCDMNKCEMLHRHKHNTFKT